MSQLKRKAHFKRLNKDMTKRFRLDPSIEDGNITIADYHTRTQALLPNDRAKLHVHIPFEAEIERIQGILRDFEIAQKDKLRMCIANALIELAQLAAKRFKSELVDNPSTSRLQQFASSISDAQLKELKIFTKYWKIFRNLDQLIDARNEQAHQTGPQFAKLLLNDQFKGGHIFQLWKDIFPVVYGSTVQELADQKSKVDDMIFGLESSDEP